MDHKYCPECGAAVVAGAKFCPECGVPLSTAAKSGSAKGAKGKPAKSNSARDLIIVLGVLVVVAAAYFLIKDRPIPPSPTQANQGMGQEMPAGNAGMPGDTANPHAGGMNVPLAMLDSLPKDFNTRVQMGNQFMDQGNYAVAAEIYKRALELNPNDHNVRVDYGACLHGMGLPQRAADEFGKVLAGNSGHAIANFNMGIVHHDMQNSDSARVYFSKYLKLEPQGVAADAARNFLKELGG